MSQNQYTKFTFKLELICGIFFLAEVFYVYILKSKKDNKFYIGQTNNIEARLRQHFSGKVLSTKDRRPFWVVGYKMYKTRSEAMWVEHTLKTHSAKKKKFIDSLYIEKASGPGRASGPGGGE